MSIAKIPNVKCSYCQADFYLPKSKVEQSKSGLFYCSRQHKDLAQTADFKKGHQEMTLSFAEMKEIINLFVSHKLNSLKVGEFELSKNSYPAEPAKNDKKSSLEDDLFLSGASALPPDVQEYLLSSMKK